MTGSNLKYTQFVFHELKHSKPPVWSFKYGLSSSLHQYADPQPQPTSVRSSCSADANGRLQPTTLRGLARVGEGISWREREEGGVSGWVVLWSQQHSEKLATAQDKHKQGHPLGRLTPRACVGACQPGLWPGGVGTVAEQHPGRHPRVDGFTPVESLHQPARSPLRLREGSDSPDPPQPPSRPKRPQAKCILHAQQKIA